MRKEQFEGKKLEAGDCANPAPEVRRRGAMKAWGRAVAAKPEGRTDAETSTKDSPAWQISKVTLRLLCKHIKESLVSTLTLVVWSAYRSIQLDLTV